MKPLYYLVQKIKPGLATTLLAIGLLLPLGTAFGQDMVRKYAEVQQVKTGIGGNVSNAGNAVNGNPREASTLSVGVGLLNAFYARQFIDFGEVLPAGTPVTIKFSTPTSVLGVADNFSIQPYTNLRDEGILGGTNWTADAAGDAYTGANLLTLLGGVGADEVTLTPDEDFEGVWVNLSSALSVAASMQVYHAYVEVASDTPLDCVEKNQAIDVLSGVGGEGLDLAGGLTVVNNPYNAIDNFDDYAEMSVVAGVANEAYITTVFATPSVADQVVRVVLEQPGTLLDVSLLSAFTIQPYLFGDEVGSPIAGNSSLLGLRLLPGTEKYELVIPVQGSFDRVKISLGGVLDLLQNIRVYEVSRLPRVDVLANPELEAALTACGSVDLLGAMTNYQPDYYNYAYYETLTGGTALESSVVTTSGTYYIEATDKVTGCVSPRVAVNATVNEYPEIVFSAETSYQIEVGGSVTLPTPSANVPTTFQWYDYNGNAISPSGAITFPAAGVYTYYVVGTSTSGGCQSAAAVVIVVSDDGCPTAFTREYATSSSEFSTSSLLGINLGSISDEANATDGNIATYSTLTETLNLLGLTGETSQTIYWGSTVNAGTPATVKLGRDYGVASVIGSILIAPVDSDGEEIGPRVSVDPNLAGLVNGLNIFEHTFIPLSDSGSAIAYSGVKIVMESVVNAIQSIRVYDAYYHTAGDPACTGQDAIDAYGGYETQLLNLNAASALIGVTNPELAIDRDISTYAQLNNTVGVGVYGKLDVAFGTPSLATDSLQIVLGEPGALLDVGVLNELRIQRFLKNAPVDEEPILVDPSLLRLRLLSSGSLSVITVPSAVPFDKVRITYGGTVSGLSALRIYDVSRVAATAHPDAEGPDNTVTICVGETLSLDGLPTDCATTYKVYDAEYGGNEVDLNSIPDLAAGEYTYWIQPVRNGCESLARGVLNLDVAGPADAPTVTSENVWVGVDGTATLSVQDPDEDLTYKWYTEETEGTSVHTGAIYDLENITADAVYYVEAVSGGECASATRTAVNVKLIPAPVVDPIGATLPQGDTQTFTAQNIPDGLEAIWYDESNQQVGNLPQYTTDPSLVPDQYDYTVVYKDPVSGATSAPTTVPVVIEVGGGGLQPPTVDPNAATIEEGDTQLFTATHTNPDVNYTWYDEDNNVVGSTSEFTTPSDLTIGDHIYSVTVTDPTTNEESDPTQVTVTVVPINAALTPPTVTPPTATIEQGDQQQYVAETDHPNGVIVWYDEDDNLIWVGEEFVTDPSLEPGNYTYEAAVRDPDTNQESERTPATLTVTEASPPVSDECLPAYERVYASGTTVGGDMDDASNAVDQDLSTYGSITAPLLLGGTSSQDITFGQSFNAGQGDELHVKIGTQVALTIGSVSVEIQAYDGTTPVGTPVQLSGGLINLLSGENQADIVVPDPGTSFNAVRVSITSGIASLGATVDVYEAYVNQETQTLADCGVEDILTGVTSGALGGVNEVSSKENAVDGNLSTAALLRYNVGVAGYTHLTTVYSAPSVPGDSIRVVIADQDAGLLDLGVDYGIELVAYMGNTPVHTADFTSGLLSLKLLGGGDQYEIATAVDQPFDRISVQFGGLVSALGGVNVYEIERVPGIQLEGNDPGNNTIEACQGETISLVAPDDDCTTYVWYDARYGGNKIGEGNLEFEIPSDWAAGEHKVYVQAVRYGCEEAGRVEVTINVNEAPKAEDIAVTGNENPFCVGEDVVVTATADDIADAIFNWYADADKETPLTDAAGVTYSIDNGELTVSGLEPGTYTYYVSVKDGADGCENAAGDLAEVEIIVNDGATAADIQTADIQICEGDIARLEASSTSVTNPVFNWYDNDDLRGDPVFTGAAFEQNGLEAGIYTYYITVQGDGVCESDVEEAVEVSIAVQHQITAADIELPTDLSQCVGSDVMLTAGVVSGITVTNPVYTWYLDAAGTQVITDGLTDGAITYTVNNNELTVSGLADGATATYYVSLDGDDVCANVDGDLASVNVTISDALDAPGVVLENVEVCNGEDAVLEISSPQPELTYNWYDVATGGTPISSGETLELTAVTADATYYVEAVGAGGCASLTRTQVNVTVNGFAGADDIDIAGETEVCIGTDVVLTPSSTTVPSPVFRWYEDANKTTEITAGIDAAGVLTLSGLADGTHTFYASVEGDGYCENAAGDLAEITITVGAELDPLVVTPAEQYVVVGETPQDFQVVDFASLTGDVIWYSDEALTDEVVRGETYTPAATAEGDYTYYVVLQNGPCVSEATEVVLHVVGAPTPPDDCYIADSEEHGTAFGCVLCTVLNPTYAIDDNPDNYSRLSMPVGLGTGSIYQTLIFDHAGKAGDMVITDIGVPVGLADIEVLGGITITLFNGTTQVDQYSLDNPLLEIELLSGGDRGQVSIPASGVYDRVEIRNTAGVATLLQSVDIYGAYIKQAAPELDITDPVVLCKGEEHIIEATAAAGTVLRWYDESGTVVYEGTEFEVPSDVAGDFTYYIEIVDELSNCADPDRIAVNVKVNDAPGAADITVTGNENAYCSGEDVVLTPSSTEGTVFHWYLDADKTLPIADGDTDGNISYTIDASGVLTVSGLVNANSPYTYFVSVEGTSGCENPAGDLAEVSVEVSPNVPGSDITEIEVDGLNDDGTLCVDASGNATLTAALTDGSTVTNPVFHWYDGNGDAVAGGEDGTLNLTGLTPGSYTYSVGASGDGYCETAEDDRKQVTFEVLPTVPGSDLAEIEVTGLNDDGTLCVDASGNATLTAALTDGSTVTNPVFYWYDGNGDIVAGGEDGTLNLTGLTAGTYTYSVGASGDGYCETAEADRKTVTFEVLPTVPGSDLAEIEVTGLNDDGTLCVDASGNATLTAALTDGSTVTNPVFHWYDANGDAVAGGENGTLNLSGLAAGTYTYSVGASGDGYCETAEADRKTVTFEVLPTVPGSDLAEIEVTGLNDDGTLCVDASGNATLTAALTDGSTVTNPVFHWYDANGDAVAGGENGTLNLSGLAAGTYTYSVGASGDGYCETAEADRKTVTFEVLPTVPGSDLAEIEVTGLNDDGTLCVDASGNATLTAALTDGSTVTNPVFHWYDANGDAVAGGENGTLNLSGLAAGTYTYSVGASGDGYCETAEADRKTVTFEVLPTVPGSDLAEIEVTGLNDDGTLCVDASGNATLTTALTGGSTVTNPVFHWYDANGDAVAGGEDGTLNLSGLAAGTYTYSVGASGDGYCETAEADRKTVTFEVLPTVPGSDLAEIEVTGLNDDGTLCVDASGNATLTAALTGGSTVTNPVFHWYDGNGDVVAGGENGTLNLSGLAAGTYTYSVGASGDGYCETAEADRVSVSFEVMPTVPGDDLAEIVVSGLNDDDTLCVDPSGTATLTAALTAASTVTNPVFHWYDANGDALTGGEDGTLNLTGLTPGTYTYSVGASGDGYCETAEGDRKSVSFEVLPTVPGDDLAEIVVSGLNDDDTLCVDPSGTATLTAALTAASTVTNPVFHWYDGDGNAVADGEDGTLNLTGLTPGTYTYSVGASGDGYCETAEGDRKSVSFEVLPTVPGTDIADLIVETVNGDGEVCLNVNPIVTITASLTAGSTISNAVFHWYDEAGNPVAGGENGILTLDNLTAGTHTYSVGVSGDGYCETAEADRKAITFVARDDCQLIVANDDTAETIVDTAVDIDILANDVAGDAALDFASVTIATAPQHGTFAVDAATGVVTYTPESGYEGADSFTYTVKDVDGFESNVATVTINIVPAPTGPIANDDMVQVNPNSFVRVAVLDNDAEGSAPIDPATVVIVTEPTQGTYSVNADGTVDYIPDAGFMGEDSFEYTVADTDGRVSNTALVTLDVTSNSDLTISIAVDEPTPTFDDNVVFTITVTNNGDQVFSDIVVSEVLPSGYEFVDASASMGDYSSVTEKWTIGHIGENGSETLTVTAKVIAVAGAEYLNVVTIEGSSPLDANLDNNTAQVAVEPLTLIVYNEFSPNGDGFNDTFVIDGIQLYPNNTLEIYNRYGNLVYKTSGYNNDWQGIANKSGAGAERDELPAGTYYYVLNTGTGIKKTGWLYIAR